MFLGTIRKVFSPLRFRSWTGPPVAWAVAAFSVSSDIIRSWASCEGMGQIFYRPQNSKLQVVIMSGLVPRVHNLRACVGEL